MRRFLLQTLTDEPDMEAMVEGNKVLFYEIGEDVPHKEWTIRILIGVRHAWWWGEYNINPIQVLGTATNTAMNFIQEMELCAAE